jgi:hypothetical protein
MKLEAEAKTQADRNLAKSLLNNLLGRFGLLLDKPKTEIVTASKFLEIGLSSQIVSDKQITENSILISYIAKPNYEIMKDFNIDITKALTNLSHLKQGTVKTETDNYKAVSVVIAACVTAYARIHINKVKYEILK